MPNSPTEEPKPQDETLPPGGGSDPLVPLVEAAGAAPRPPRAAGWAIPGYELAGQLGRGAMGVVYKARQVKLDRPVALKVMFGCALDEPADRARVHTEAMAVAQIQHPNVIQIFDVGEHDGIPFLAVEYLDGGTLEAQLAGGPLPVREVVRLGFQIARGVGAAHARGIVHRDLKPANILLTADGVPKVADFGLAKQLGADSNTVSGAILGTPAYMSPEQAAGQVRRVGPPTDVFALGVILYECLTGVVPFKGDSVLQTIDRVRTAEPLEFRFRRSDVPPELEAIVFRCLNKAPTERYPTADALADDLARLARDWGKPAPRASGVNVYHVLTLATAVAAVGLGFWLVRLFKTDARPAPAPADSPASGYRFDKP
jgi:serine/threonine protein kinase